MVATLKGRAYTTPGHVREEKTSASVTTTTAAAGEVVAAPQAAFVSQGARVAHRVYALLMLTVAG